MHGILIEMNNFFQAMGAKGLALNAFIESFFLVPPPDFLLITMDLLKPQKAVFYAAVCTAFSVLGALVGYAIGFWGGRPAFNFIFKNKQEQLSKVEKLYGKYGCAAVFFSAFTPIPYKIFTIASGILNMNLAAFTAASILGRGLRFFIVSVVLMLFGEMIKQYIEWVILGVTLVIILFFAVIYKKGIYSD
ncbi:MAG: DedA family protein [Heliobacteriaceae bacterium]|jgi:undecaprenyl-diphosphatase|nr:DedA family protein [Heliobacteriaceae bacterium]